MPRIIKKYANRRLYDTETSRYITLDDLKQLIVAGVRLRVIDAKSEKDIGREVLLQLVAEQESLGQPILSEALLTSLIRFYDHPLQKLASRYLETALGQLQDQQKRLTEQMRGLMEPPADLAAKLTRQQLDWLSQMQQSFLTVLSPKNRNSEKKQENTNDQ
ncbi:MAG: polyhydroxyalkanoate synthesis repressor PhaR [Xanthomonadales bacterium]|nr:polyhydroxyalkanoate synthesis repressor PhaR [Xanthomonadales bacterium]